MVGFGEEDTSTGSRCALMGTPLLPQRRKAEHPCHTRLRRSGHCWIWRSSGKVKMAGSTSKGGAPYGNRNSFKHGMYRRQEMAAAKERGKFYRDYSRVLHEMRKTIAERIACPAR